MDKHQCDFSGYATRNDLLCGDGRTIRHNAFKDCHGQIVPLVWNHDHTNQDAVLGHALLENRDDGVYAYGKFNDTEQGRHAKELVQHGDVRSLSIYANKLKQLGGDVIHGVIRELSLVLAGANPGAFIDFVLEHGDEGEDALYANYDENAICIYHSDVVEADTEKTENLEHSETKQEETKMAEEKTTTDAGEMTVQEVIDSMSEEQKNVMYALIGQALEDAGANEEVEHSEGGNNSMKNNVFDQENTMTENHLSHSDMEQILADAKRYGSLKDSYIAHAGETEYAEATQTYGINGTDWLFPDAHNLNKVPEFIKRDMDWVQKVLRAVHHTPFSRIKSTFANITEEDARAKGYIKGKLKKEEVFGLLKRTTTPTTIYKKQKMDRDDIVDITDFDVVAWLKAEMRMMLDEEIARAILVGDGRPTSSDDKISEQNIRPILKDEDLYTIKATVTTAANATADEKAKAFIKAAVKARKDYKGSGEPSLYTTEDVLTDCLLMEDSTGRIIYDTVDKLKNALRVKEIITVPVLEGVKGANGGDLLGIIVNLADYNVGADKGGAVNMFDDFDIDYNQQKYLIETRCSGALVKPYSAIAFEAATA